MRTLGIDLSADPGKTGACEVDWTTGTVTLLPRPTGDDQLVDAARRADMIAIDVPLGWPDPFIDALVAHRQQGRWPPLSSPPPADRTPLRFRRTDVVLQGHGSQPLSVSSDRIGVAAMRGARIQALLTDAGVPVDRSGTTGRLVEAYPAAALRSWGLPSTGYKGRANLDACRTLAVLVTERCGPLASAVEACLDGCDDDALDAFLCAVIALAAAEGLTAGPSGDDLAIARREGWIHLPTAGLTDLVARG